MDNNNNKKSIYEVSSGGWGVGITTHPLDEVDLLNIFTNSNQSDVIYLLTEKKYSYVKEVNKLLMMDSRSVFLSLLKKGIIEEYNINNEELEILSLIKGINKNSLFSIKTYKLSDQVKVLLQNPFIYKMLIKRCNINIKKYIEYLGEIYNNKIKEIEDKKQIELDRIQTRYNIAKRKPLAYRTAEDLCIIDMIENG